MYVVGKAGRQHWQHVYTAVTRGRGRVYVIAEESHLRSAIMKSSAPRKTRLKHFLQNKLSKSCASLADSASPSESSGDSSRPGTQPSTPSHLAVTASTVTPRSKASAADDRTFPLAGEWKFSSPDEVDTDEDPSKPRGSKRACGMSDAESPSKVLMVRVTFSCAPAVFKSC